MTRLDTADLVVIAGQVLGIGTDAALARIDLAATQAALAEAALAEAALAEAAQADGSPARPGREAAAGTCARLMHALLRHRPFPQQAEQVAVAAGLQYLSLNGWRADLDPPATAVVVVEALASGRLSPADAAAWLTDRLSPRPGGRARVLAPRARELAQLLPGLSRTVTRARPFPGLTRVRALASLMLTIALGGLAMLAAACASGPASPPANPAVRLARPAHASHPAQRPRPARPARLTYTTCPQPPSAVRPGYPAATGLLDLAPARRPCPSHKR